MSPTQYITEWRNENGDVSDQPAVAAEWADRELKVDYRNPSTAGEWRAFNYRPETGR